MRTGDGGASITPSPDRRDSVYYTVRGGVSRAIHRCQERRAGIYYIARQQEQAASDTQRIVDRSGVSDGTYGPAARTPT